MYSLHTILLAILTLTTVSRAATYQVIKEYVTTNSNIFKPWDYYGREDNLTNGDVDFISEDEYTPLLVYILLVEGPNPPKPPKRERGILKVDNTTKVPRGGRRKSVRITTQDSFDIGSLWVADIYHAPYG